MTSDKREADEVEKFIFIFDYVLDTFCGASSELIELGGCRRQITKINTKFNICFSGENLSVIH